MKVSTVSGSIFVLLTLAACDMESEDAAAEPQTELSAARADAAVRPIFHATVGAPIDAATGTRWIENHRRAMGREVASYTIRAAALRRILKLPGCVGISLQYGVNDSGELQLFPIGVDGDGRGIADTAVPAEARRFIDQYTGTVKSHFYGRDTFTRLLDERRSETVRVTPALDDDRGPQLLLSDAAEKEPRIYEDLSNPCRSACPSQPD